MSSLTFVCGGARSGKSKLAESLALQSASRPIYLASAQAFDEEMTERIMNHRRDRGERFHTVEAPLDVLKALDVAPRADCLLWDCLTIWLSNQMLVGMDDSCIHDRFQVTTQRLLERYEKVVIVSNEVGLGVVPENKLSRRFRDLAGKCHQNLSDLASEVYFSVMGLPLRLKPQPVEVIH